jgi:DNA-binding LacI/PurR family transcriptional regulator
MGQMAMENLFKLMSGLTSGQDSVVQIKVEAELIVRGSTGKAQKRERHHA